MNQFVTNIVENLTFVLEFVGLVAALVLVAVIAEKLIAKKNGAQGRILTVRKTAMIGMFSAIAGVLMTIELPVPFAPPFYGIDASELPVLICGFAFGPAAGVLTEFIKIIIKLFFKPTSTAFVGELANFCVGCSMILPATLIYHARKKKTTAVIGSAVGTLCMTIFGTLFNAVYLLPTFAVMFGMPLEAIIGMGTELNPNITDVFTFVAFCVAPLNLLKGSGVSILTFLLYKPLSPILKASYDNVSAKNGRAENA
ncbi:MAG: ECF transporter S component [Lachnospiraceae bacterium]|nr:ECF transporter S component [Lachnospiraceae bacterium]MDE7029188.1 ECF transporter S component [Lachnospiraceae bacterium]